jgi:hypothetical protein
MCRSCVVKVRSILLRPAGIMVVFAAVHIEVDGSEILADCHDIYAYAL